MRKLIIILFSLSSFLFSLFSSAQVTFQKTFSGAGGDKSYSVQQTIDGGYIILGGTGSFGTGGDIYLIKTDINGDTSWTRTFGGTDTETGINIKQTTDGGYIISGTTSSFDAGGSDIYLIKTDTSGDTLWTKTYGGTSLDIISSIRQTADEGYIIAGSTQSFGAGFTDVYLLKTNNNGDTLWTKTFGGINSDGANSVRQDADGGYIVSGTTQSFGAGSTDSYLIRTNINGDLLWAKTYGGTTSDGIRQFQQTVDGGYITAGHTTSFGLGGDIYLIRTDGNGDTLWTRTYGGTSDDDIQSIDLASDGGFIIAGETNSFGADWWDSYMLRTDSNGNILWSKTYKFGDNIKNTFYDVKQTSDGGFIAVGETGGFLSNSRDVYVVKTDAYGNSGCGDSTVNTLTGSTATIVGTPATIVGSGAIVGSTATITGSTATVDSVLCFDTITSIINEKVISENAELSIFPNPFTGSTTIAVHLPDVYPNALLILYDITGRSVHKFQVNALSESFELKAEELGSGFFYACLTAGGNILAMQKLIVLK